MKYYTIINMIKSSNLFDYRLKMVELAKRKSISEAVRIFDTTRKTVRKWVKRFDKDGLNGLKNRSRAPKKIPHKLNEEAEQEIVRLRIKFKKFGPQRLKDQFELPYSTSTIYRVLKNYELIKKRKKKYQKKKELYEIKKKLKPFEKIQVDVKYLNDINNYFPNMIRNNLPKYQITARDVKTGGLWFSYAYEKTTTNTGIFASYLIEHFKKHGIISKKSKVIFQNDNGGEFIGNVNKLKESIYEKILNMEKENIINERTPPARPTYNSDVEASHKLIEEELYDVETLDSQIDLLKKAYCYQLFFNYFRKNRGKENQTPIQILKQDSRKCGNKKIEKVFALPPIITDLYTNYFINSGYHVPEPPNNN